MTMPTGICGYRYHLERRHCRRPSINAFALHPDFRCSKLWNDMLDLDSSQHGNASLSHSSGLPDM